MSRKALTLAAGVLYAAVVQNSRKWKVESAARKKGRRHSGLLVKARIETVEATPVVSAAPRQKDRSAIPERDLGWCGWYGRSGLAAAAADGAVGLSSGRVGSALPASMAAGGGSTWIDAGRPCGRLSGNEAELSQPVAREIPFASSPRPGPSGPGGRLAGYGGEEDGDGISTHDQETAGALQLSEAGMEGKVRSGTTGPKLSKAEE